MPVRNEAERTADTLSRILDRQRADDVQFPDLLVEGRNADGTIQVRDLRGECVATSNVCSAYQGQVIQIPCGAPFRVSGAAGVAMARVTRPSGTLWLESVSPSSYLPGGSYTVTMTGKGFKATTQFEFLIPGTREVNPDVTVNSITYVSATQMLVSITIAVDADPILMTAGGVAYDNPGWVM